MVQVFGGEWRRKALGSSFFLVIFDQGIGQMVVDEFEVFGFHDIDRAAIIPVQWGGDVS